MVQRRKKTGRALPKTVPKAADSRKPDRRVRWSFIDLDRGFPLASNKHGTIELNELLNHLRSFEQLSLGDLISGTVIDRRKFALQSVDDMPQESQKRLRDLGFDDYDKIIRMRVGGTKRVYGLPPDDDGVISVLWLDPEHKVWPSSQ